MAPRVCITKKKKHEKKKMLSLGGLEPPTFRLTAERATDCATESAE